CQNSRTSGVDRWRLTHSAPPRPLHAATVPPCSAATPPCGDYVAGNGGTAGPHPPAPSPESLSSHGARSAMEQGRLWRGVARLKAWLQRAYGAVTGLRPCSPATQIPSPTIGRGEGGGGRLPANPTTSAAATRRAGARKHL